MDRRTKQGILAVTVMVIVGTVVAVSSAAGDYAGLGGPAVPTVSGITTAIDGGGTIRLYRSWTDGYTDWCRKINGGEDYTMWLPVE